ncbi:MAG: superinfection immunity protein [Luteolibacter sp.]|uniref:superinfection immunity protein n=1 Tax=Luteolibacter sp. TaxID=1962973 RepID=UPI0032642BBB
MIQKLTIMGILHGAAFLLSAIIMESQSHTPGAGIALVFIFVGLGGFAYLLPGYIAAFRNAPRFSSIFGLNLFAGWTGLGWIATLIWSFVDTKKEAPQVIIQHMYTTPQPPPPIKQQERQNP